MRDLRKYPMTIAEIETCLNSLAAELLAEESIGDMRPLLLRTAAKIVVRAGFTIEAIEDLGKHL